jgi:predicted Rossmann fold flavoprotein
MPNKKVVVIGGGAAGFFCAVNVARLSPGLDVILLEKTSKLLSKVKISGGGRCNLTHACFDIALMAKKYPRGGNFVRKAFHQFFTTDTIQWFEERGVAIKQEADGRMFPVTDSSQTIIDCLMKEADIHHVKVRMNTEVKSVSHVDGKFNLLLSKEEELTTDYVCIACGGYPKASMFSWLTSIGHSVMEPVPSLFTFNIPAHPITKLMGIAVERARVKITGTRLEEEGPILITHWGLSGPAVLRSSAWGARDLKEKNWEFTAQINWLPDHNEQTLKDKFQILRFEIASQKIKNKNPFSLPARLWEYLVGDACADTEKRWADLPAKDQNKLIRLLCNSEFQVKGKTTYKEEFVTAGGIVLNEVDANSMQSKLVPGLFFAGEILDVDGITGGFNFQHAWTSGWIAAKSIAAQM